MAFALQRLGVFVLAQNILVQLHVGTAKVCEPVLDALPIFQDFLGDIVRIYVDADRADDPKFLSLNRNRCAFESARGDVQLVVQFVFV